MTDSPMSVWIVARPGPLRAAIQALMAAMPQIEAVRETDDISSALAMGSDNCPGLVLLDSGVRSGEIRAAVERIRARWPQTRCVFLANDVEQQREAESAGVDVVLLKGHPAAKFAVTIVALLES